MAEMVQGGQLMWWGGDECSYGHPLIKANVVYERRTHKIRCAECRTDMSRRHNAKAKVARHARGLKIRPYLSHEEAEKFKLKKYVAFWMTEVMQDKDYELSRPCRVDIAWEMNTWNRIPMSSRPPPAPDPEAVKERSRLKSIEHLDRKAALWRKKQIQKRDREFERLEMEEAEWDSPISKEDFRNAYKRDRWGW